MPAFMNRVLVILKPLPVVLVSATLVVMPAQKVLSLTASDYFNISYSIEFSEAEIIDNQAFFAQVSGTATCIADLPLTVTEAYTNGRIVARQIETGAEVVLNPSYTLMISPFPDRAGDAVEASVEVTLQFPEGSEPGVYEVFGELIEARVKAVLWLTVTSYLPPTQFLGSIAYKTGDDEPQTPTPLPPGTTDISEYINAHGVLSADVDARSVDLKCIVSLMAGSKLLDKWGRPVRTIKIEPTNTGSDLPEYYHFISKAFVVSPKDATSNPPALISIEYDESLMCDGVNPAALRIFRLDEAWVELGGCVLDENTHTISAPIDRFSVYAVLGHNFPANFILSELKVSPNIVNQAEGVTDITISVHVANTGDLAGLCELFLVINGKVIDIKAVSLSGGEAVDIIFNIPVPEPGYYRLDINGVSGEFVVIEGPAAIIEPVVPGSPESPNTTVTQTVTPAEPPKAEESPVTTTESIVSLPTSTGIKTSDTAMVVTTTGVSSQTATPESPEQTAITTQDNKNPGKNDAGKSVNLWWFPVAMSATCSSIILALFLLGQRRQRKASAIPASEPESLTDDEEIIIDME